MWPAVILAKSLIARANGFVNNPNISTTIIIGKRNTGIPCGIKPLKYPKTPGNLLARAVDYSPLGFLKAFTYFINSKYFDKRYSQRQLSLDIARGISGTAMWTLGLYLLYLGIASGGDDDNDKLTIDNYIQKLKDLKFDVNDINDLEKFKEKDELFKFISRFSFRDCK